MGSEIPIPVIDMCESQGHSGNEIIQACEEWGCFRVVNHKIPFELMGEMKSVVRTLLDRPMEMKRQNTDTIAGSGYMAPSDKYPLYEALGLYDINSSMAVDAFCAQLGATAHDRETIKSYAHELHKLAMDIGCKIAEGMNLGCDLFRGWPCQFRINKYSFTKENIGSPGVRLHTDSSFLTILQEDDCVGGLEVMDKTGTFLAVDPFPGSFLINLGDIAKAWSNGRFCNLKHRVQCKEAKTRITIAMFLLGPKEEPLEAPSELVDSNHPRLYVPFTYQEYRQLRVSKGLDVGEALDYYTTKQAPTMA